MPPLEEPVTTPPLDEPLPPPPLEEPVTTPPLDEPVTTPPLEEPVTTPPLEEPVITPPLEEPVTTPPLDDPVTTPPLDDPVTTPPDALDAPEEPPAWPEELPLETAGMLVAEGWDVPAAPLLLDAPPALEATPPLATADEAPAWLEDVPGPVEVPEAGPLDALAVDVPPAPLSALLPLLPPEEVPTAPEEVLSAGVQLSPVHTPPWHA